jgi:hypothetical protein
MSISTPPISSLHEGDDSCAVEIIDENEYAKYFSVCANEYNEISVPLGVHKGATLTEISDELKRKGWESRWRYKPSYLKYYLVCAKCRGVFREDNPSRKNHEKTACNPIIPPPVIKPPVAKFACIQCHREHASRKLVRDHLRLGRCPKGVMPIEEFQKNYPSRQGNRSDLSTRCQ